MYTAFYGLREKPFVLSPDPRFLYLAGSHREALAHLLYGIEQGEGFISVTGEVGTGKTTLCRTLLERLDGDLELAFLFNPSRTALELLQSICAELGLPAEGLARRSLMHQLNTFLVEQKRVGRRVLLIIDEAQTLSENTLEQVRLLSNLETSREKLIQILLLGQPELDRKLDERSLRQLRQRISVRWKLDPLGAQETRAYVRHRLAVAAGEPKDLFSDAALREVHRRTGGIPRLVNQLCDRALLAGYAARAATIGPRLVRVAAKEIPDARLPSERRLEGRPSFFRPWMIVVSSLLVVGLSLFAGLQVGRYRVTQTMGASVFKSDEMHADFEGANRSVGPPAVSAKRPAGYRGLGDPEGASGGAALPDGPPLMELISEVPAEVRVGLRVSKTALAAHNMTETADRAEFSDAGRYDLAPAGSPNERTATPAETALAPGLLGKLLATRKSEAAFASSRDVLLERFGRRVARLRAAPTGPESLRAAFEARGLMATTFDGGSLELLRRLDHPVAIPLAPSPRPQLGAAPLAPESAQRWVAITGFKRDRARVSGLVPGQVVTVTTRELEAHWLEAGIIVWERFEPVPLLLGREGSGSGVLWLQRALAELRFLDTQPTSQFDASTADAVRRFQSDRGLVADGVAGPLTQIALYAELGRYPVPRLSQAIRVAPPRVDLPSGSASRVRPPSDSETDLEAAEGRAARAPDSATTRVSRREGGRG